MSTTLELLSIWDQPIPRLIISDLEDEALVLDLVIGRETVLMQEASVAAQNIISGILLRGLQTFKPRLATCSAGSFKR